MRTANLLTFPLLEDDELLFFFSLRCESESDVSVLVYYPALAPPLSLGTKVFADLDDGKAFRS